MYDNALFMIHNPLMVAAGNAADLREQADWLERVGGIMRAIYMGRCTKTEAELQAALEAETYLSADEALDWGFATRSWSPRRPPRSPTPAPWRRSDSARRSALRVTHPPPLTTRNWRRCSQRPSVTRRRA